MSDEALRYAVLDENGTKLNGILVNDPYPADYWPGYGAYIVCEFGEAEPTLPPTSEIRPGFYVLSIRPDARMNIGDTMDLATGHVTPAPQPEPEAPTE